MRLFSIPRTNYCQYKERPFIDLYHTAAILSPRRIKSFVFAPPASHWMRGWTGKIFCKVLTKSLLSTLRYTCARLLSSHK